MNVAIIPARGGSKRIPRKNIIDFGGKPMIAHSIQAARDADIFDHIVVSTDDAEIAAIAREYGAEVPFTRRPELSDDYSGTVAVVADAITEIQQLGIEPTAVCCIYATAPFVRASDLKDGLTRLISGDWQYVFSATTFEFPIYRSLAQAENGGVKMIFPEHQKTRSQDLPEVLHDAGQFYWGRTKAWLEHLDIFADWSSVVRLPRWRVQDIDSVEDLDQARRLFQVMIGQSQ